MAFTTIETEAALKQHCAHWATRPWLAVDTEFVRVDTYYPKLCLVQISDGETHACVDVLAVTGRHTGDSSAEGAQSGGRLGDSRTHAPPDDVRRHGTVSSPNLSPLWELLHNPRILKLLHAASQDYEIFVQLSGRCPTPLFDSQIAATLLGIGDQIGYAGLIEKMLGIPVDKSLSRTDWLRRPLTTAELAYAAADVEHLATIYPRLHQQLVDTGRLGWLAEDCARACDPALYQTRPEDAWRRLKGLARLPAAAQNVAARLTEWREREAQARDRPRKWILDDEPVYRIAERQPSTEAALEQLQVLPPKTLAKHGAVIVEQVAAALQQAAESLSTEQELSAAQKSALQSAQALVRTRAESLGVPATYIAPKADLMQWVTRGAAAEIPLLRGWRREQVGAELLATLER